MKRLIALLCSAVVLVFGSVACSQEEAEDAAREAAEDAQEAGEQAVDRIEDIINDRSIRMDDFTFDPVKTRVKIGQEVTWTNKGKATHTVTSDTDAFASKKIKAGKEFSHRFTAKGEYKYHCEIHPAEMQGTVYVTK